ncbi:DUF349 domain-containing protein [Mumia zhuanghuii]|uniref:DUF349 domain-containing protein n=2 Tax=Mumia TaxID=1546255 RepID=A0ABW1QMY9_9ACTN|nr:MULTISPECIES: DUF349 domain-containing protein [Mumia]KAA1423279.1 DUF349 domain-containing protein [Mumia zhuanghuii]
MSENLSNPEAWGRIDEQGTVYVRTREGERVVGQWPDGDPGEAMALFTRRYEGLAVEVELLEKRIDSDSLSPEDAKRAVDQVREAVDGAAAVGDLDTLKDRLDALGPKIDTQRERRKAARAERAAEAHERKVEIATTAEQIAASDDWRRGADRLREMLEQWKSLPRLDKNVDDELWHRFSTARTAYTRRRKAHFAEQNERRGQAQQIKERLVTEAEALSGSTEWGPTAGQFRDLMAQWKAAGPAPRGIDDRLWKRFRAAQDTFFGARDEANAQLDAEYAANAEVKVQILAEAEALLPIEDLDAARAAWRDIADRWEAAGKVPRGQIKELEGRLRAVEKAISTAADDEWRRSNPETRARVDDTVSKLEKSVADIETQLEAAKTAGNDRKVRELQESLEARQAWLDQARKSAEDLT